MARGINKVILVGNVGRDPEIRYTQDGNAVVNFSVATNMEWTDSATGEKKVRTEWHRIVAFGKLGEICGQYLTKGRQVYIEGRLQTRSWEQDGITRYTTEIIANEMQMLGSRNAESPYEAPQENRTVHAPQEPAAGRRSAESPTKGESKNDQDPFAPPSSMDPGDDIPF